MKNRIKQIVFTIVILVITITVSSAQFRVGANVGISAVTQSELGNVWNNEDLCCHFNPGVVIEYGINDWLALKSGMYYSAKGKKIGQTEISDTKDSEKYKYLSVPLKAKFSSTSGLGLKKGEKVFFATGPYLAYLLDSKRVLGDSDMDIKDETKNFDFGMSFELGIEIPVKSNALQFSINYDMGLSSIIDYDTDLRNKAASINLAFLF